MGSRVGDFGSVSEVREESEIGSEREKVCSLFFAFFELFSLHLHRLSLCPRCASYAQLGYAGAEHKVRGDPPARGVRRFTREEAEGPSIVEEGVLTW